MNFNNTWSIESEYDDGEVGRGFRLLPGEAQDIFSSDDDLDFDVRPHKSKNTPIFMVLIQYLVEQKTDNVFYL